MLDARADDWLARLTTTDGTTLGGFASVAAAQAYDYTAPLRWFPGRIAVTETPHASGFPVPAYAIATAVPDTLDLVGLALGYAELYALTDPANPDVGGAQPTRAMFDGDPFDGPTIRARSLAMLRVAVIDLDRLHGSDPTTTPVEAAYTILGLRTVLRALGSELELYSNNTPDAPVTGALDALPIHYPGNAALTFGGRVRQMIRDRAKLLYELAPVTLDDHTAAIRGLFAAYLATGDVTYRTRALALYDQLEATFYDADARMYTTAPAAEHPSDVTYTPLRFTLLQSTLRDVYELVATRPGGEALALVLEGRIGRLDKLVLDGWDDANRDQHVYETECVLGYQGGTPHGGLQMAERALTGEIGRASDEGALGPPSIDRNFNCVPEVDDAHLPAGLAASITFHIHRPAP